MIRKEQLKMASELGPQDISTGVNETSHEGQADVQPTTYEQDPARAEVMAYAENPRRERAKEFMKVALKAADNIEAGDTQPVSYTQEYEWDPPFSDYQTKWEGQGSYDESDKSALLAIASQHPNMERFPGDHPTAKDNFRVTLNHEEIADAAIEHAQTQLELASRDAEWRGAQYDEKQQEAAMKASEQASKANDLRSRIGRLQ